MQTNLRARRARFRRAILAMGIGGVLAGCGGALNESMTATSIGGEPMATAGLGVPPDDRQTAARPIKVKATPDLIKQVRSLEGIGTPGSDGYRIGPQDVLDISVYLAPDLTKTVQVAETGTINLPLVGDIQAGGVTARELERALKAELGKNYFQDPQVTVFVKEYNSQRVTLEGAISRPGVYPYRGPITLLQLVATAGGLNEVADGTDVMVFRTASGARQAAKFNVDEIKAGRTEDPPIIQGDVVIVNTSTGKKIYNDILKSLPLMGAFGLLL
jgi:polysaccharide export outer membrane protein